jgi:hypothetical protein
MISDDDLIHECKPVLIHLAKARIDPCVHTRLSQLYAMGFNAGGRPDGLWLSEGSAWLKKVHELRNPKYPLCCYIYEAVLKPDARILRVRTDEDFAAFDARFPSYWLNMDYFTLDFVDYTTNKSVVAHKKYQLDLNKLRRRPGESMRDTLIGNNIIFTSAEAARNGCDFYAKTPLPIERFKYKDWNTVASEYQGVVFEDWHLARAAISYLWFQSLDVSSGCIWDASCISRLNLLYSKSGDTWENSQSI